MTLAIVFPGQGSQSVGMVKGFADLPIVEQTFRCPFFRCECSHIVSPYPACLPVGGGDMIMPRS